jgi:hypothetical protein
MSGVKYIASVVTWGLVGPFLMAILEDEERPVLQHFLRANLH